MLKEARALRKARIFHHNGSHASQNSKGKGNERKEDGKKKSDGQAPSNGTSDADCGDTSETETPPAHPSVLLDARERISSEGAEELRLCYIQNGRYGGVEIGNPDGSLGRTDGFKLRAYRRVLADDAFREQIGGLLRKSVCDHERFLAQLTPSRLRCRLARLAMTMIPPPMVTTSWDERRMRSCSPKRFAQGRQAPHRHRRPWTRCYSRRTTRCWSSRTIRCFSAFSCLATLRRCFVCSSAPPRSSMTLRVMLFASSLSERECLPPRGPCHFQGPKTRAMGSSEVHYRAKNKTNIIC